MIAGFLRDIGQQPVELWIRFVKPEHTVEVSKLLE